MLFCVCVVIKLKNAIKSRSPPKDIFLLLTWFFIIFFLLHLEHYGTCGSVRLTAHRKMFAQKSGFCRRIYILFSKLIQQGAVI